MKSDTEQRILPRDPPGLAGQVCTNGIDKVLKTREWHRLQLSPLFLSVALLMPLPLLGATVTGESMLQVVADTNVESDLGLVIDNRYYVTDSTNASVGVFDPVTKALLYRIKGVGADAFMGVVLTNGVADDSISGPRGINAVGGLLYVGDVNSVKVIEPATGKVLKTITVGTSGKRAYGACVDTTHNLYMISTPEAAVPFATFIDSTTQSVVAQVTFTDSTGAASAGLEQCRYDAGSDTFFLNNAGSTANPHGELVAMRGASIREIAAGATVNYTSLTGVKMYNEGYCGPNGLALGSGNDIAVSCRADAPLLIQIMDRTNGTILKSIRWWRMD